MLVPELSKIEVGQLIEIGPRICRIEGFRYDDDGDIDLMTLKCLNPRRTDKSEWFNYEPNREWLTTHTMH